MWIWTLFPWLIPQDPQPFQAPHRKPHTLCITIQAYFGAEKQKIERNTELPGLPQSVPQLLNVSVEKRGLVPTIRNYQEESMKYLALSSPSSPRYFLAQTSWGEKKSKKVKKKSQKKAKDGREPSVSFIPMIIWMLLSGGGWVRMHQHGLVEVRFREVSPSGDGMTHAEVEHGIWFMHLGSGEENGLAWVRSKWAYRRVLMVKHGAFSMHKWTNNQRQALTVHAYIHERIQVHATLFFSDLGIWMKQHSPTSRVTLTQNMPPQVPRCENVTVAPEWTSTIEIKAVQPADLLFSAPQRTACYLWACRGHKMDC